MTSRAGYSIETMVQELKELTLGRPKQKAWVRSALKLREVFEVLEIFRHHTVF